jgi:hypothetical protein
MVVYNYNSGGTVNLSTGVSTGIWYYCFLRASGGVLSGGLVNLNTLVLQTINSGSGPGTFTPQSIYFGSNSYDGTINGRIAGVKVWNTGLTNDELLTEARSIVPSRFSDINFWCPLIVPGFECTRDHSGNGRDLTLIGAAEYQDSPPVSWNPATLTTNQLSYENYKLGPRFEYSSGTSNSAAVKLPAFRAGESQAISLSFRGIGAISAIPAGWNTINNTVNGNTRLLTIQRLASFADPGANTVTIGLPVASDWVAHGMSFAGRIKSNAVLLNSQNTTSRVSYIPTVVANVGDYVIGTITSSTGVGKSYRNMLASRLSGSNIVARYFYDEQPSGNSTPYITDYSGNEHHQDDIYFGNVITYNRVTTGNTAIRSTTGDSKFFARRPVKAEDSFLKYASGRKWTAEIVLDKNSIGTANISRVFSLNNREWDFASLFGVGISDTQYVFYWGEGGQDNLYGNVHAVLPRTSVTSLPGDKAVIHWVYDSTRPSVEGSYSDGSSQRKISAGFFVALAPSGSTAPTYVSNTFSSPINLNTSPYNIVLNKPPNVVQNDVLIAVFSTNDGARTVTPPSGWEVLKPNIAFTGNLTFPDLGIWSLRKVAGESEPSTYTFEFNSSFNGQAAILAYRGALVSAPSPVIGTHTFTDQVTTNVPIRGQAITTVADNSLILWVAGVNKASGPDGAFFSPPPGYTERVETGGSDFNQSKLSVADTVQPSIGSTGGVITGTRGRVYLNGVEATVTSTYNSTANYSMLLNSSVDIITYNRGGSNIFWRNGAFSGSSLGYDRINNSMERTPVSSNLYYAALYADALNIAEIRNNSNALLLATDAVVVEANTISPSYTLIENVSRNTSAALGIGSSAVARYIDNPGTVTQQTITFNQTLTSVKENGVDYIARSFVTAPTQGSTVIVTLSFSKFSGTTPAAIDNPELFDNQGNHYKCFSASSNDRTKAQYIFVSHNVRSSGTFTIYVREYFDSSIKNYVSWGAASFLNVSKVGAYAFNSLTGAGANASVSATPTNGNSVIVAVASVFARETVNANISTPTGLTNLHKQYVSPFDFDTSYIILSNNAATRNIQWNHTPNGTGTSNVWIAQAIELRPNITGTFDDTTGFLSSNSVSNFSISDGTITTALVIEPVVERKGLYFDTSNGFTKYSQVSEKTAKSGKLVKYQSGNITTLTSNVDTGFYTETSQTPPLVFDGANLRTLDITKEIIIR